MVEGDLRRRIRPLRAAVALLALLVATLVTGYRPESGLGAVGAGSSCSDLLLRDWRADGSIGGTYETGCYLDAIDALPEDVRAYTSAEDDITRALQAHVDARTVTTEAPTRPLTLAGAETAPAASSSLRLPPLPVLMLGAVGVVLLAGALAAGALGILRRR